MRRENLKKYWYSILPCLVILLGILLRLKGFLANPSFEHDECAMAWNIKFKDYFELFGILRFLQVAPPFFSVITKFLTQFLGFSEMVFRLIPFLAGCLSIIAFYFLASKTLKVKSTIFWAVFLFAINQTLINFSFELKHYSLDVFFTIICLLFFVNLNIEKLNKIKSFIYGTFLATIPWFSFVSMFIIAGGFWNLLINKNKSDLTKKTILILPVIISGLIYLKLYLINNYTGTSMISGWQNYFITLNPIHFLHLLAESIRYLFFPIHYVLFALILFVWGLIIHYKEKSIFSNVAISSFIMFIIASFMHIYPFGERVITFLIPIYLLFMLKPLDLASFDKKFKLFIILVLTFFIVYPEITSAEIFIHTKHISRGENPREMTKFLVENLKPNDNIFVNNASNTEFEYYSSFYNFKNNVIRERLANKPDSKYLTLLNSLPKGYYWFYLPFDYPHSQVSPLILSWIQTNKILLNYANNRSILIYVYVK